MMGIVALKPIKEPPGPWEIEVQEPLTRRSRGGEERKRWQPKRVR